jgi:plastocyanin
MEGSRLKNEYKLSVIALSAIVFTFLLPLSIAEIGSSSTGETNVTIALAAENFAFNASTITVPAGANVTIVFDNKDAAVGHNFALYETPDAIKSIFVGDIIVGPRVTTYSFKAPDKPGTYFFRCDVHWRDMKGNFIVE